MSDDWVWACRIKKVSVWCRPHHSSCPWGGREGERLLAVCCLANPPKTLTWHLTCSHLVTDLKCNASYAKTPTMSLSVAASVFATDGVSSPVQCGPPMMQTDKVRRPGWRSLPWPCRGQHHNSRMWNYCFDIYKQLYSG